MELTWIIVLTLLIVGLASLMFFIKPKQTQIEAFISVEGVVDPNFNSVQTSFADNQFSYNHNTLDKEILTNPGLILDNFSQSVKQPGISRPNPRAAEAVQNQLQIDPYNKFTEEDDNFCRTARKPSQLPGRRKSATVACGWWYVEDPNTPSMGALGRRTGPLFPDNLPQGGEWIWGISDATTLENIKLCKQITNCNLVGLKELNGLCGFCPDKGHSMPVKTDGTEMYPDMGLCGSKLIQMPQKCPKPDAPVTTPDGISCGTYGEPSEDGSLRLYSKAECTALDPLAKHTENGMCLREDGNSYSVDCRNLNAPAPVVDICDPDAKGRLSRACLLSLSQGMGYTNGGAIVKLLSDPNARQSEIDAIALSIMATNGITIPPALLGSGDIDANSATEIYYRLLEMANGGTQALQREAAKWLVFGTNDFDPCAIPEDAMGPFLPQCIQREFRKAGCQPAGKNYPGNVTQLGKYNNYRWSNVIKEFQSLYNSMSDSDGAKQDEAVKKCLGMGVSREKSDPCPELVGIWQYADDNTDVFRLTIRKKDNIYFVEGWAGTGSGEVQYDKSRRQGTFKFILYKDGKTPWDVEFSYNPMNTTLYWDAGRTDAPFKRVR